MGIQRVQARIGEILLYTGIGQLTSALKKVMMNIRSARQQTKKEESQLRAIAGPHSAIQK
jgi:hypothetical protein